MKVQVSAAIETSRWTDLLRGSLKATPFHHEGWARVLAASFPEFEAYWVLAVEDDGSYVAGLPVILRRGRFLHRAFSMPFGTYGGPLIRPGYEGIAARLLGEARRFLSRKRIRSFSCHLSPTGADWPSGDVTGLRRVFLVHSSTHILELGRDFQSVWRGFQKRNRQVINKAIAAGTTARSGRGVEAAEILYRLYSEQARRWRGHKPYPYELIRLCATYEERPFCTIWQAELDGAVQSSVLVFYSDSEAFPWLMGSTPRSRRLGINNFLMSEIIRDACQVGLARVNLGGSMGNPGIEHFKRALGAEKVPVVHYIWEGRAIAIARRIKGALRRSAQRHPVSPRGGPE